MPRLQSQERFVKSFCVRLAVEYLFQFQTWVPNKNGGPLWTGSVEWNSLNIRNLQTAMPASNGESFVRPTLLSFSTGECLLNGDLGGCEGDDRITRMDSPGVGNAISCKRESAQCFAADSRVRQEGKIDFVSKNTKMGENHNFLTGTPENNFLTDHETRDTRHETGYWPKNVAAVDAFRAEKQAGIARFFTIREGRNPSWVVRKV